MGAAASTLPDTITKEVFQSVAGDAFTEEIWEANASDGSMTKEKLISLGTVRAQCEFKLEDNENGDDTVGGSVNFVQLFKESTKISYTITGLSPGEHAMCLHECADFSEGLETLGGHFNPHKKQHGGPTDEERHVGDLGNIVAGEDGVATGEMTNDLVMLSGEFSVVGRSILIMDSPDDMGKGGHELSLQNGNCGDPVAYGEIVRQTDNLKRMSTARQKNFITQVTSSRILAPSDNGTNEVEDEHDGDDLFKDENLEENENPTATD